MRVESYSQDDSRRLLLEISTIVGSEEVARALFETNRQKGKGVVTKQTAKFHYLIQTPTVL